MSTLVLVAAGLMLAGFDWRLPANHDVAWLLYVGRRLLAGDRMGVDLIEVNPPLIVWISTGVAWLARAFGTSALALYRALVLAAAVLSIAAATRIAGRAASRTRLLQVAFAGLLAVLAMPGYGFGQRAHLLVILMLPYLAAAAATLDGDPAPGGRGRGVLAGVGFALKPHFLLAWLAVEALLFWKRGRAAVRPELAATVGVLAAYAAAVTFLTPSYLVTAVALWPAYARFAHKSFGGIFSARGGPWIALGSLLVVYGAIRTRKRPALSSTAGVAAAALVIAALLQAKGWPYQWYPAAGLALFSLAVGLRRDRALPVILAVALAFGLWNLEEAWSVEARQEPAIRRLLAREARGRPVLVLSNRSRVLFPAVEELGLRSDSPYPFLWMLQSHSPDLALAGRVRAGIGHLVELHPPGVIVTDDTARGAYSTDFFRGDPDIAAVLDRCQPVASLDSLQFCKVRTSADGRVGQTPRS